MYAKLADRFGGRLPTPTEILADDPQVLLWRSVATTPA